LPWRRWLLWPGRQPTLKIDTARFDGLPWQPEQHLVARMLTGAGGKGFRRWRMARWLRVIRRWHIASGGRRRRSSGMGDSRQQQPAYQQGRALDKWHLSGLR
jgi:hypothetical protein